MIAPGVQDHRFLVKPLVLQGVWHGLICVCKEGGVMAEFCHKKGYIATISSVSIKDSFYIWLKVGTRLLVSC